MWRGPFAYGHATATRIFLGFGLVVTGVNDRERPPHDPAGADPSAGEKQHDEPTCDDEERRGEAVGRTGLGRSRGGRGTWPRPDELTSDAAYASRRRSRRAGSARHRLRPGGLRGEVIGPCRHRPRVVRLIRAVHCGRSTRRPHRRARGHVGGADCPGRAGHRCHDGVARGRGTRDGGVRGLGRRLWLGRRFRLYVRARRRLHRSRSRRRRLRRCRGRSRLGRRGRRLRFRRGRGCGRRRGCRRRVGSTPRREQAEWVDVRVAVADPNPEMDVRRSVLGLAGGPWIRNRVAFGDGGALPDTKGPEMGQRRPVAVVRQDRDGEAVRRYRPRERDLARGGSTDRAPVPQPDVDAAMLARRVLVVADRERSQHGPVGGPGPGESAASTQRRRPDEDADDA
jgi:hypothetical protein